MEAFVKIYGRKIAELVQQVYEIEQLRDKCNRKCTIKTIKKEKIMPNKMLKIYPKIFLGFSNVTSLLIYSFSKLTKYFFKKLSIIY